MSDGELPEELVDPDAPAGTPSQQHIAANAAPVWCAHGVRWQPVKVGWVADDALSSEHRGHDHPAVDVGSIPCQPTYASEKMWWFLRAAREAGLE